MEVKIRNSIYSLTVFLGLIFGGAAQAGWYQHGSEETYRITITNITKGMLFTPFIAASHNQSVGFFSLGEPASMEIAYIAEAGDTAPMAALLNNSGDVYATSGSTGPLLPGQTVSFDIQSTRKFRKLSLAAMLVPTNDTFISLVSVDLPLRRYKASYLATAYDAGSEPNDELCVNMPGPFCGGQGYSPETDGEGFIYPGPGIHGEGDLSVATYDWSDPVAKIVIQRMN
jgi:hypothetical protein